VEVERKQGREREREREREKERKGFMVSGSSDCSVCVWDLTTGKIVASSDAGGGSTVQNNIGADLEGRVGAGAGAGGDGDEPEREVNAEVRAVLKGHVGGVLDLRIDRRWIVSWCVFFFFFSLFWL
jgi:F-box and WD-40 domain protein 1/11